MEYETPKVMDHGDISKLTAACVGSGPLDDQGKTDDNPFANTSPAFGDPSFCNP